MAVAQGNKTAKKAVAPKTSKSTSSHPPYIQMITEALVALKERTGSSHYAIVKHIEEEQKIKDLPGNFKKILSVQLKKFVLSGKLVKVKNSFKLPPKTSSATAKTAAPAAEKPKVAEKKAKKPATTAAAKTTTTAKAKVAAKATKDVKSKSLKPVKSPMKKKAPPAVAKAKKPKSIKSPVKKTAVVAKKAAPAAKKAKK